MDYNSPCEIHSAREVLTATRLISIRGRLCLAGFQILQQPSSRLGALAHLHNGHSVMFCFIIKILCFRKPQHSARHYCSATTARSEEAAPPTINLFGLLGLIISNCSKL